MRISEKKGVRQITMGITNKHDFQGTVENAHKEKNKKNSHCTMLRIQKQKVEQGRAKKNKEEGGGLLLRSAGAPARSW